MAKSWRQYKEEYKDDLVWAYAVWLSCGDKQYAAEWLWYKEQVEGETYESLEYMIERWDDELEEE